MWNHEIFLAAFLFNIFWYAIQLKSELKLKKKTNNKKLKKTKKS